MSEFLFVDLASDVRAKLLLHAVRNVRALGGPGSGNFGHSGRPGQQGGSGEGDDEKSTEVSLVEKAEEWKAALSKDEIQAIKDYTGDEFEDVNRALRSGTAPVRSQGAMVESLNHAIDSAPVPPPPSAVWRGVDVDDHTTKNLVSRMQPGAEIQLNGFQSTSIDADKAISFAGTSSRTLFEITPSKGAYISSISQQPQEKEFLLPHGHTYVVKDVQVVKIADFAPESRSAEFLDGSIRLIKLEMR